MTQRLTYALAKRIFNPKAETSMAITSESDGTFTVRDQYGVVQCTRPTYIEALAAVSRLLRVGCGR